MFKIKTLLPASLLLVLPQFANAAANLESGDFVGISFWLISMALVASTAFFFLETQRVSAKWKTSLTVSGLVTLVAAVHYFYMRDVWISTGDTPTVYRYIDWLITVPLLMVEFYIILRAVGNASGGIFWRLMIGSLVMLVAGYMGEAGIMAAMPAFIVGMLAWIYMIYELWAGEGKSACNTASPAVQSAYNTMMWIIIVGWAIYPLGYASGYLVGDGSSAMNLNLIYNLADFVNKILFGLIIWNVAVKESSA